MEIRVADENATAAWAEADYVRVETRPAPDQDTVTLATIERVVKRSSAKPFAPARRIKTVVPWRPMSADDALGFATSYATSKKIPLVLTSSLAAGSA